MRVKYPRRRADPVPSRPYPTWQPRHEAVLLYMLERPRAKLDEVAQATGYSRWQVSHIRCAPEFSRRHRAMLDKVLFDAAQGFFAGGGRRRDEPRPESPKRSPRSSGG